MWKSSRPSSAFAHRTFTWKIQWLITITFIFYSTLLLSIFFHNNFLGIEKTMKLLIEFTTYDDDDDDGDYYYCYYYYSCLDCVEMLLYSWQANGSRTQSHTLSHCQYRMCVWERGHRRTLARIKTFFVKNVFEFVVEQQEYIFPSNEYYESHRVKVRKECVCARKGEGAENRINWYISILSALVVFIRFIDVLVEWKVFQSIFELTAICFSRFWNEKSSQADSICVCLVELKTQSEERMKTNVECESVHATRTFSNLVRCARLSVSDPLCHTFVSYINIY